MAREGESDKNTPAVASVVATEAAARSTAMSASAVDAPGSSKKRGLSDRWRGKGSRGKYRKMSREQRRALEEEFVTVPKPDSSARDVIAAKLGTVERPMTNHHVGTWFMNRRTKQRKMDSGELKPKSKKTRLSLPEIRTVQVAAPANASANASAKAPAKTAKI